jgi:putative flippase GtrA
MVSRSLRRLKARVRTPGGRKAVRYSLVSVVSVLVNQVSLFVLFAFLHWTARSANIMASVIAGVPSYYLNRHWAWQKKGRSHLVKEILPFWVIALAGLAFSTWAADFAETQAQELSRLVQGLIVNAAAFTAFGVLWVGKFIFFNKVLFVTRDEDVHAALADEVVA